MALPKPPSYADEQTKVTIETINFNKMRMAAKTTISPRSLRSMAEKPWTKIMNNKTVHGGGRVYT